MLSSNILNFSIQSFIFLKKTLSHFFAVETIQFAYLLTEDIFSKEMFFIFQQILILHIYENKIMYKNNFSTVWNGRVLSYTTTFVWWKSVNGQKSTVCSVRKCRDRGGLTLHTHKLHIYLCVAKIIQRIRKLHTQRREGGGTYASYTRLRDT